MQTLGDVGAGHTLGRYELLIPIASGGMAAVWAARMKGSRGFQKIVAIKVMLPELADDPSFEKMFLDEAEIASRIRHPNVAEILDLGEQDGVLYQVMEWVDGEPLHQISKEARSRGGLPLAVVIRMGEGVCAGLHAAHDLCDENGHPVGLVHRDVSPQNILVTYEGVVKVVDFGVAKAASSSQQTVVGQMKGKVPYMSPEQARGDVVDRRTDVFALGVIMFQLVTGKHPFRAESELATLRRICDAAPAPAALGVAPSIPVELDAMIAKALAKDRHQRFASMAEMMRALEAVPVPARASPEDVAALVRDLVGARGDKRRASIKEALKIADERAGLSPTTASRVIAVSPEAAAALVDSPRSMADEEATRVLGKSSALPGIAGRAGAPGIAAAAAVAPNVAPAPAAAAPAPAARPPSPEVPAEWTIPPAPPPSSKGAFIAIGIAALLFVGAVAFLALGR